jgi:hypothetical protein
MRIKASTVGTAGLRRAGIPIANPSRIACAVAPAGRTVPSSTSSGATGTDKPTIGAARPALAKPMPAIALSPRRAVRSVSAASRLPAEVVAVRSMTASGIAAFLAGRPNAAGRAPEYACSDAFGA